MPKLRNVFLVVFVFAVVLIGKNTGTTVNTSKNMNDYQAQLTYYNEDHINKDGERDVKSAVWYGTIPSSSMNVDSNGWYHYNKDGVNYLVVAAATTYCRDAENHCGVDASHGGYAQNIPYYNYGDTFELTINGEKYPAMVMDSCGACMWGDRDIYGEKFDIYVPTANPNSGFVNPTGLPASKDGDGPSIIVNPELQPEVDPGPEIPVEPFMQYAPLGKTSYSGDIEQGYIHGNQGGYSLHFGKNATKSEKEETILDIVQDIYEEAIVRPSDLKNGAEAYKTHVTYLNNGIFNGQIAYYSQGAYNTPGSYGGYGSIATHGCGPTSMSIVLSSFGQNVSPVESTNWACSNGYCTGSGSKHSLICDESNHYGLNCSEKSPFESSDQQELVDKLSSGNYLAVVLAKTGHFTSGGHFFVLTGVNDKNEITVADPGDSSKNNNSYSLDFLINPTQGHVQKVWLISK